jgi:1-deoxy-D-xylulose-5-phosphate synthase
LDRIYHPSDIKSFSLKKLRALAQEIRDRIIEVMSVNGGHLSSNLGIVELTIALHYVFNSPQDQIIFDVSHQCYSHKLLSGRASQFEHIRQYKGLCGFSHPGESPHDHYFAGHAGTALSTALGAAKRRDLEGSAEHIIPVLGDASLTCGLTLEALNLVNPGTPRLVTILNDNARSISENVGNIKNILNRHTNFRSCTWPDPADPKANSALDPCSIQPAAFFEMFGFSYIGPVDGHDIDQLVQVLQQCKDNGSPLLLHVMTTKGKGMPIAIANPVPYHGARPFDICSGKFLPSPSSQPTFPKIFGQHLLKMAEGDSDIVVITPAMAAGSCLEDFQTRFADRFCDVGIAEGHAVTYSAGIAAKKTKKVVCCIYATFMQRALDNLFQDVCMQNVPVLLALDRSFISGPDGSTHHGIYDIAFLNAMPNLVIAQPRNGQLLKELMESAFGWDKPVVLRYPNLETETPSLPVQDRDCGCGEVLSSGDGILLIGLGHHCETALAVKRILLTAGINATVVDPIFIKPFDAPLFHKLLPTHLLAVTIEEHALNAGFGMIFNSFIVQNRYKEVDVINFGIPDRFIQFGSHMELMQEIGLDAPAIASRILQHLGAV